MQTDGMSLRVITPDQTLLNINGLTLIRVELADGGSIGIRPNHHPLLAETRSGNVEYGVENYEHSIGLESGILEIDYSRVTIYTSGLTDLIQEEKEGDMLHFERLTRTLLHHRRPKIHPE